MRYVLLALLFLTACSRPEPARGAAAPRSLLAAPLGLTPGGTLLASYAVTVPAGGGLSQPRTQGLKYQPGTGVLSIPTNISGASFAYKGWLTLTLNRAAKLTIPGGKLPWMTDWSQASGGYSKTFPAGVVVLGPPSLRVYPSVTIAEADGQPNPVPTPPAGQPVPAPNQPCPAWVHEQYAATGPDGISYPTWHPQIDPTYWCSFGHEHGSQPAAGTVPLFGYSAARHGMTEPHAGFKVATVAYKDQLWTLTQHFGTGNVKRACVRFHTLDVALTVGGTQKADLHFMGDFGRGQVITRDVTQNITGCGVDQASLPTTGARKLSLGSNKGYEPWRSDLSRLKIGLYSAGLTFITEDSQTACPDLACLTNAPKSGNGPGAGHHLAVNRPLQVVASAGRSGVFYSDPLGERLVPESDAGATRQYLEPGVNVTGLGGTCFTVDAWVGLMHCGGQLLQPLKNIENALTSSN